MDMQTDMDIHSAWTWTCCMDITVDIDMGMDMGRSMDMDVIKCIYPRNTFRGCEN
jgi:hypothetical protein